MTEFDYKVLAWIGFIIFICGSIANKNYFCHWITIGGLILCCWATKKYDWDMKK